MKSFRENIIKYGILLIVFILPLLVLNNLFFPYISLKTYFFYGATELIFASWLYSLVIDKSYRLEKKQILFFIPLILYILWLSLAGVFAANPALSFWGPMERGTGLLTFYHTLAFSLVLVSLIKREGKVFINRVLKYFLMSSFILAISVWFGNEGLNLPLKVLKESSGGGLSGNSSFAAAYFVFSIFFCLYFIFEKSISKNWKVFTSVILATILFSPLFINLYGLFTSRGMLGSARGALLGIFVGVSITILFYLALSKKMTLKVLGIIGIFISIITFIYSWHQLMKPDTYLHNKFVEVASDNRFLFWGIAQKSMDKHPYFGYGPENYMIAFQENFDIRIFDSNHSPEAWSDKAHNIYFDTGVSGGYPAIALYFIFILSIFYGTYKAYKKDKISQIQASAIGGMLIGYVFQNLFVFDSPVVVVALFMTLGIVYALQGSDIKEKYTKTNTSIAIRNLIVVILSISFVFSFVKFAYMPLVKSRDFIRVMRLDIDKRPLEYMSLLEGSKAGDNWDASYFAYQINLRYSEQIKNLQSNEKILSYVDADLTSLLSYLNKLSETNKTDYRLYLSMLHLYNIKINILAKEYSQEEFDHILSLTEYAHSLAPMDPQVYWDAGFLKLFQGDTNGALTEYRNAINLDRTSAASWKMLLKIFKMINQPKFYDITLKEAQKNIPDFKYEAF